MALRHKLFFSGELSSLHGWGVCNTHLLAELSKLTEVVFLEEKNALYRSTQLPGHFFCPIAGGEMTLTCPARGIFNHGYTFFERELPESAAENSRRLDSLFVGSSWCRDKLLERGVPSTVLIQGVDHSRFHPSGEPRKGSQFIVFSGGKFEYRKGQDLVLRAMAPLLEKYPDMQLVNAWCNMWRGSTDTMAHSPHIRYELVSGSWRQMMSHIYSINAIDSRRIITLPLIDHDQMAKVYATADLSVFPNRCEGGTNLVLMETMASGVPAVASGWSGHADVLTDENCYRLAPAREVTITEANRIAARWQEPEVREISRRIEEAYLDRATLARKAHQASADMKAYTWQRCAMVILDRLAACESARS